jgi:hypothetical protein
MAGVRFLARARNISPIHSVQTGSGTQVGYYEERGLLSGSPMRFGDSSTFQKNTLPQTSGSKSEPSNKLAEASVKLTLRRCM